MQRDEADNQSGGDPRELHYYFDGIALGDIGNNGTSDVDYATSIAEHRAPVATGSHAGAFNYGTVSNVLKSNVNVSTSYADFDQAYDPINGLTYQNTSSQYTVAAGDTLQSIAYQIWGDASFWYMIADANGLMGDETLSAGQVLTIPNKVHNSHNTSDVFRVYDPNEAIGNNSPTAPKPQKHHSGGCGGIGQILVAVVSIAVTIALPGIGGALGAFFQTTLGGIAAAAIGSAVGQGFAVATGIQSKFNWGAVAMAAVSAGVSAGLGEVIQGADIGSQFLRGALGSAITQGIGVATGLQKKFDWAGVAAAGVSAGVGSFIGGEWVRPQLRPKHCPRRRGELHRRPRRCRGRHPHQRPRLRRQHPLCPALGARPNHRQCGGGKRKRISLEPGKEPSKAQSSILVPTALWVVRRGMVRRHDLRLPLLAAEKSLSRPRQRRLVQSSPDGAGPRLRRRDNQEHGRGPRRRIHFLYPKRWWLLRNAVDIRWQVDFSMAAGEYLNGGSSDSNSP